LRTTAAHLPGDNAKPHTSKIYIKELDFILLLQPPYSLNFAPCDFFLFGCLKQYLAEKHLAREDQVIAAGREVFDKIPLHTFQNVMDDWQHGLITCIQLRGEYLL
jgi:hypothetical protein